MVKQTKRYCIITKILADDILALPTITVIGFGPILGVLLAVASRIVLKILKKKGKLDDIDDTASRTQFVCTQCGAIAKKGITIV